MPATHASDRQLPRLQAETPFMLERLAPDLRSGRATVCVGSRAPAKHCRQRRGPTARVPQSGPVSSPPNVIAPSGALVGSIVLPVSPAGAGIASLAARPPQSLLIARAFSTCSAPRPRE